MRHGVRTCVYFWNRWLFRQTSAQAVSLSKHCVRVCLSLVPMSLFISRAYVPLSLFILFETDSGRTRDGVCRWRYVCVQFLRRCLSAKTGGKSTSIINGKSTQAGRRHHCLFCFGTSFCTYYTNAESHLKQYISVLLMPTWGWSLIRVFWDAAPLLFFGVDVFLDIYAHTTCSSWDTTFMFVSLPHSTCKTSLDGFSLAPQSQDTETVSLLRHQACCCCFCFMFVFTVKEPTDKPRARTWVV